MLLALPAPYGKVACHNMVGHSSVEFRFEFGTTGSHGDTAATTAKFNFTQVGVW